MKIYDQAGKRLLTEVTLFLSPAEMRNLGDSARRLAEDPHRHHDHVSDAALRQEITLAVYTRQNLDQFDEESRGVIGEIVD